MAFDVYDTGRHIVLSTVPDYSWRNSWRRPVGFLVVLPGAVRDEEDYQKLLDHHMLRLQREVIFFPDALVNDILSEERSPEIAIELARKLHTGDDPGAINFVYYPEVRRNGKGPEIDFDAAIVATRGYGRLGLPPDFLMLYRQGQPVVGVCTLDGIGSQVISGGMILEGLQHIIMKEFASALSQAEQPHFIPNGDKYAHVVVNPANAYGLLRRM